MNQDERTRYRGLSRRQVSVAALLGGAAAAVGGLSACSGAASKTVTDDSLLTAIDSAHLLKAGIRTDDPPHSYIDAQGKLVGFDVDIAEAIANDLRAKLQIVPVDELSRISFIQNGKIDVAITSISKTRQRAEEVDFSQTYFWSYQTFLVRKGEISSLAGLVGKTVGGDRGSNAPGQWQAWLKSHGYPDNPTIELFGDKQTAANAVLSGAIAGYTEDYEILASFAKQDPALSVLQVPGGTGVKLDGIAMHKNDSALMLAMNLALQDIARSGEYYTIYDKWFGPKAGTPVPLQGHVEVWPND
jgi:polar amino acid transport system substrate-binding protein